MRYVWAIFRRETRAYSVSLMSYTAVTVFLGLQGVLFWLALRNYQRIHFQAVQDPRIEVPTAGFLAQSFLASDIVWPLLLIVPLLTMQLLAGEKQRHTAELLLTAPMTTRHVVLGKFFGSVAMLVVMLLLMGWIPLVLRIWGNADPAPIAVGFLGALLYGSFLMALGLFASSLTESPFQAALLSLLLLAGVFASGEFVQYLPFVGDGLVQFTPMANLGILARGVLDTQSVIYFVSLTVMMVELTARTLDSQRWR